MGTPRKQIKDWKKQIELINITLSYYDERFKGSKDWNQSDNIGKVQWLAEMVNGYKQQLDTVWEMLESANTTNYKLQESIRKLQRE
jgi:hypothetical protein